MGFKLLQCRERVLLFVKNISGIAKMLFALPRRCNPELLKTTQNRQNDNHLILNIEKRLLLECWKHAFYEQICQTKEGHWITRNFSYTSAANQFVRMTWWRHQMEPFSALLALCAGNSPVPLNSPHKGQWRGGLMFSLIFAWINDWVNNREAGDLRRHRGQYDVNVMIRRCVQSGYHCQFTVAYIDNYLRAIGNDMFA